MSNSILSKELQYYIDNQNELVKKYAGKVIAIKNQQVLGVYDSELEAIEKTSKKHELGSFLVKKCEKGKQSYTQSYYSRVVFN